MNAFKKWFREKCSCLSFNLIIFNNNFCGTISTEQEFILIENKKNLIFNENEILGFLKCFLIFYGKTFGIRILIASQIVRFFRRTLLKRHLSRSDSFATINKFPLQGLTRRKTTHSYHLKIKAFLASFGIYSFYIFIQNNWKIIFI